MFFGTALVIVGAMILLNRLEIVDLRFTEYLLPALMVAFGFKILTSSKNERK